MIDPLTNPRSAKFSLGMLVGRTLAYFLGPLLGIVGASAVTTAILTGGLVLGDSLRASLLRQAIDRLGSVDDVLLPPRFVPYHLATKWATQTKCYANIVPIILVSASIENLAGSPSHSLRANSVQVIGCSEAFWKLGWVQPRRLPGPREIILNQKTAELINAKVGDRVIAWLPVVRGIPVESSFGRRQEMSKPLALRVIDILPDESLAAFQIYGSQETPRNAFVDLPWLAQEIDQPGRANAFLFSRKREYPGHPKDVMTDLEDLPLAPEDYRVTVLQTRRGYLRLTSDTLIIDPAIEKVLTERLCDVTIQKTCVYLAETVTARDAEAWYVVLAALPFFPTRPLGPFVDLENRPVSTPEEDECVVNEWLAARLKVQPGDRVTLTYFAPEIRGGSVVRRSATLKVKAIVRLEEAARDPELVPEVRGLTDKATIADWDPPFPFDATRVTREDEEYWEEYRATPKLFVSPIFAEKHWASRYGRITGISIVPESQITEETLRQRLVLPLGVLGWQPQPVKEQAIAASQGTTPFDVLFLMFNFFVILASLLLTGLLFALNVERRTGQIGVLKAIGWRQTRIAQWLLGEAMIVITAGALAGILLGIGYAKVLIWGLHTVWRPAIGTAFISLVLAPRAPVISFVAGVTCSLVVTALTAWQFLRLTPQSLLMGTWMWSEDGKLRSGVRRQWPLTIVGIMALGGAIILVAMGLVSDERSQAASFFGSGALALFGLWIMLVIWLKGDLRADRSFRSVVNLAMRNLGRNPTRSGLSTIMMALAIFLILSVSSFRMDVANREPQYDSGDGGFWLLGESDQPIFTDLNDVNARKAAGINGDNHALWRDVRVFAFRRRSGEDASCLNLYRPREPVVLGVSEEFINRGGFRFTAAMSPGKLAPENPWELLKKKPLVDERGILRVPAIVDDATAKYSLHKWRGVGESWEMVLPTGKRVAFEFVALLDTSIFQGKLLIWEENFRELFPEVAGYRYFLVETKSAGTGTFGVKQELADQLRKVLEKAFGPEGLQMIPTQEKLAALYAVQNTYLSTFQSLGGLGLLLGTIGLGAVVFRGLLERRREIALLSAVGFTSSRLQRVILLENLAMLFLGLGIGTISSLLAVAPQLFSGRGHFPWQSATVIGVLMIFIGVTSGYLAGQSVARQSPVAGLRRE